jgi:hypothetical protein
LLEKDLEGRTHHSKCQRFHNFHALFFYRSHEGWSNLNPDKLLKLGV